MTEALRQAVAACIELDKAEAVIIGGGPLGNAAIALTPMFSIPVIAPIPAAVRRILIPTRLKNHPFARSDRGDTWSVGNKPIPCIAAGSNDLFV
jgi:hypothetical protein